MRGMRWLVALFTLGLALLAGGVGEVASSLTDSETSVANTLQAWTSTPWVQTIQADFEAGILSQADTRSSPGDVGLTKLNRIFALQGASATFWAYGVPDNLWTSMTGTPNAVGPGGALAYDGVQYIYALRGNNTRAFWRHDTVLNSWAVMANTPAAVGTGGSLAYDGVRYIYAFRGNNQRTFWRYDTASNTWTARANAPAAVGTGGALAYDGVQYIYALRGNNQTAFWRYDTALNSWAVMSPTPNRVGAGGALTYDGSRYVYALRGNNQRAFWSYDTVLGSWAVMSPAPSRVGAGGALASDGLGCIFAFRGNGTPAFWRYDAPSDTWTAVANTPGNVANGSALVFVLGNTYVNSSTIASQVRDTGRPTARWDGLFWDETLPPGADVAFEVRASDILFAGDTDNATLAWIPVGGTSPVTSGLPAGRYMQWRATLTTSDVAVTPVLQEVRLYHY